MKLEIRFGGLKRLRDKIIKKFGSNVDATELIDDILLEAGKRCLAKTQERTPVDTGKLKGSWRLGSVRHKGFYNTISIENKEEYATYIEFGHRVTAKQMWFLKINRILDSSKDRRSKNGWYEGHFMATKSIEETKEELPEIAEEMITKKLSDIFP